jgi:putative heme iron utilization protein
VEPQEYEEMLRTLVRIAAHQETINDDLRASITELREFNRQQVAINARLETTLQAIKDILGRDNGR